MQYCNLGGGRLFLLFSQETSWIHRFESLGQARAVINHWIRYYNEERPHQSLDYVEVTPSRAAQAIVQSSGGQDERR
ncbi:integrase core domain-containing protein [Chromohalobacter beijerinckii]|uniref:Integrase core domain-containing protein n=2 Tax=Chromohalobacter beijerinckii TaxID=86179 RepID=A0ABV8XDD8_9GAMM